MPLMLKVIDKIHLTCVLYIMFVFFKTSKFECSRRKIFGTWVAIFVMVVEFHKRRMYSVVLLLVFTIVN